MPWNQLNCLLSPCLQQFGFFPTHSACSPLCPPCHSILPLFLWLYIAVSISALPRGWSCRTRLWEICVRNLIWSPQDPNEWAACVCEHKHTTTWGHRPPIWLGGSLCQAGRKGQNQQASLLNWCGTTWCISFTKSLLSSSSKIRSRTNHFLFYVELTSQCNGKCLHVQFFFCHCNFNALHNFTDIVCWKSVQTSWSFSHFHIWQTNLL